MWGLSDHASDFDVYSVTKGQPLNGFKYVMKCMEANMHTHAFVRKGQEQTCILKDHSDFSVKN